MRRARCPDTRKIFRRSIPVCDDPLEIHSKSARNDRKESEGIDVVLDFLLLRLDVCLCGRVGGDGAADCSCRVADISREVQRHAGRALVRCANLKKETEVASISRDQVANTHHDRGRYLYETEVSRTHDWF